MICPEMPIAEYSIVPTKAVAIKVDPAFGVDPVDYLSVLGMIIYLISYLTFFQINIKH